MSDEFVLGIDGGGTGCRAILTNESGHILSFQSGPACNYQNSNSKQAADVLSQLLNRTKRSIDTEDLSITSAVFGLAGLDSSEDAKILQRVVSRALSDNHLDVRHLLVENDGIVALQGLIGQGPGVILLSGTGSIAWGIRPGHKPIRSGGWGHLLGDEGSGYAIGKSAILAMLRGQDGRGPMTGMESELLTILDCHSLEEIAERVYSDRLSVSGMASLAPAVFRIATEGNEIARKIVDTAVTDLADMISAVVKNLHLNEPFQVALCGGILENQPILREQVSQRVASRYPNCKLVKYNFPSALGSTACALRYCRTDMEQSLQQLQSDYENLLRQNPNLTNSWVMEGSALS